MQHPHVSLQDYLSHVEDAIACKALSKQRIYLDQNYWIFCRDAALGRPQQPLHAAVYDLLVRGVELGIWICPAHYTVMHETSRVDSLSNLSVERLLSQGQPSKSDGSVEHYAEMNRQCALSPKFTFTELYAVELMGAVLSSFERLHEQDAMEFAAPGFVASTAQIADAQSIFARLRCHCIVAGLKAEVRYTKQNDPSSAERMFAPGDDEDHFHAMAALPHCQYFFTERVLANRLSSPRLRHVTTFDCKVLYKPDEIVETLSALLGSEQR
ncbi:MAG: hypothetical protein NTU88_09985 [Armatimonadetes bacterium]|nr:hypothetical protein [Armatimonadota bacterium]